MSMQFSDLSIPDSELAKKATKLVFEASPEFLFNHCVRTFLFADLIGQKNQLNYDRELLYLGAVMHDLGFTDRFNGPQRFEVDGADAARSFLLQEGRAEPEAELIWDAIALHTSIGIASRKAPEIALVHLGTSLDAGGFGLQDLDPEIVERVINAYPRLNCGQELLQLVLAQIRRKPQAIAFTWMAEVGRSHIHGFACPTFAEVIRNNPLECTHS
jgi:hypothetical protein